MGAARSLPYRAWIVDGTVVPPWPHAAGKSNNYRYSCNAQVLSPRSDLLVIAIQGAGPGNRNDPCATGTRRCSTAASHMGGCSPTVATAATHTPAFARGRIVRDNPWRRHRRQRARVEHCIARLNDWQILRDHRRRGRHLPHTLRAVAYLHNLRIRLRGIS